MKYKAVFLDRDGVINIDHAYVHKIEEFEFIDGVFEACQRFIEQGYKIVVVTNQSGIGRGYYDEAQFKALTDWMCAQFLDHNVKIDGVYYCPHHPKKAQPEYLVDCNCRKPHPGMLLQAIEEHNIDPTQSIMVGDKGSDMEAATAAGVKTKVLVRSGQNLDETDMSAADLVCESLSGVPDIVLKGA
ncbi:D-glycero-beta-D-manno-heptose-1,7-bisphosphate 7-phosphatase [Pseudoalteromonas luteoviolacea]|uniref:D,D-heptose 1,7-bisphosphate phosphatase n=1 Tax=Pseudoalteromonas luteoviolacea TaxID=43657 RepID=A0A1C0TNZ5_9GAMM|nr:D-glycero-beta-D-manno-heptose 1,7-bisphosphate 7-phosphatase [Pseudoalteromonas luteoviolacea]MBQ4813534.1 D-glycero-beta-D-manno-heptose 1,7-bisphosphate 7-phosphatase [Pseudoalteromonas luteoviolacea]OCQ20602.1 D-glycero-beta-D-manno-heptose-1,7-bisphosphate 7-phosphatase [Pseudoalteromonas luteoviolacea]